MTLQKWLFTLVLVLTTASYAQNSITEITTAKGLQYLTTTIDYPILGTYLFNDGEPVVELNGDGTGVYQLHDQPKRIIIWGMECFKEGTPVYKKGFDNRKYYLFYKYTTSLDGVTDEEWNKVEFTIHLNSGKIFINGERAKSFTPKE
ncbi:hypothetical protein [Flavobacterium sp.]